MAAKAGYHFVSETEPCEEYICPVTDKIMLVPHQTNCCGHHLSSSIATKLTSEHRPCPVCSVPCPQNSSGNAKKVFTTRLDLFHQKKIRKLQVYCPHRKERGEGCKWVGPIIDYESHVQSCDMLPWECKDCGFQSSKLVGKTEHAQACPKRLVLCNCDEGPILACDYDQHLTTCPAQLVPCKFADVGCMVKSLRKDMESHMKEYVSNHQLLVSERNLKVTLEIKSRFESQGDAVRSKEEGVSSKSKVANRFQEVLKERENEVDSLKKALQSQRQDSSRREEEVKRRSKEVASIARDRHMDRLIAQLEERDETIQRLRLRNESVVVSTAAFESLQAIVVGLRHKKSVPSGKEMDKLKSQLEEIVDRISDTQSQFSMDGGPDPSSPINLPPDVKGGGGGARFCRGKFERIVMTGLKKPWGMAVGGDKLYVVDNSGYHGMHIVNLKDPSNSVETMIEAASISDVTISQTKCWYPRGVALDADLNVILVDTGCHRVLKFTPKGKLLAVANPDGTPGNTSCTFNVPIGIAINSQNRMFVCDRTNHRIQILDENLQFVKEFGQQGSGPEEFVNPWDVAFDSMDNVYIADCGNRCVKVFTSKLHPLRTVGKGEEKYKKGDLRAPSCLCVDRSDFLYVADTGLKRVCVYNSEGKVCCSFGKFSDPHGIAVDGEGHVYVSDTGGGNFINPLQPCGRVQMFS